MTELLHALLAGLRATTPVEAVAVVLGLAYVVLAALQRRWCWPAGGASAALYVWLSWRAQLPMQAALQFWYVLMAVQGWRRWSQPETARVGTWPWRRHLVAIVICLVASALLARGLAGQFSSSWPLLDSATTLLSLFATWLTTRKFLESWLYWIAIDTVLAGLYAAQGLVFTAGLFVVYLGVCVAGLVSWTRQYRSPASPA